MLTLQENAQGQCPHQYVLVRVQLPHSDIGMVKLLICGLHHNRGDASGAAAERGSPSPCLTRTVPPERHGGRHQRGRDAKPCPVCLIRKHRSAHHLPWTAPPCCRAVSGRKGRREGRARRQRVEEQSMVLRLAVLPDRPAPVWGHPDERATATLPGVGGPSGHLAHQCGCGLGLSAEGRLMITAGGGGQPSPPTQARCLPSLWP